MNIGIPNNVNETRNQKLLLNRRSKYKICVLLERQHSIWFQYICNCRFIQDSAINCYTNINIFPQYIEVGPTLFQVVTCHFFRSRRERAIFMPEEFIQISVSNLTCNIYENNTVVKTAGRLSVVASFC